MIRKLANGNGQIQCRFSFARLRQCLRRRRRQPPESFLFASFFILFSFCSETVYFYTVAVCTVVLHLQPFRWHWIGNAPSHWCSMVSCLDIGKAEIKYHAHRSNMYLLITAPMAHVRISFNLRIIQFLSSPKRMYIRSLTRYLQRQEKKRENSKLINSIEMPCYVYFFWMLCSCWLGDEKILNSFSLMCAVDQNTSHIFRHLRDENAFDFTFFFTHAHMWVCIGFVLQSVGSVGKTNCRHLMCSQSDNYRFSTLLRIIIIYQCCWDRLIHISWEKKTDEL